MITYIIAILLLCRYNRLALSKSSKLQIDVALSLYILKKSEMRNVCPSNAAMVVLATKTPYLHTLI